MPIGWMRDVGGGSSREVATERNTLVRQTFFEQIQQTVFSIIDDVVILARRELEAEIWTRWETASDEKVCPICGPYTGHTWKQTEGPQPPLHPNCRCQRVYAFTVWK